MRNGLVYRAIFDVRWSSCPSAMSATKEFPGNLRTTTNHFATTVFAEESDSSNSTFEAIKDVPAAGCD